MFDRYKWKARTACLCMAASACLLFQTAKAAEGEKKLADIVTFTGIELCYIDENGQMESEAIGDGALIGREARLGLCYTYEIPKIPDGDIGDIAAGIPYYLEVSPHLILPHLESGSPLTADTDAGTVEFGKIYADGNRAWIEFRAKDDGSGTIISEIGELTGAYFYLQCGRAGAPPEDGSPVEGENNLYAMKFENKGELLFGYAELELELAEAKAKIEKDGGLRDKAITWTIDYTPWQNPSAENPDITADTPFELVDTIDSAMHSYVGGSIRIDGLPVTEYDARDKIPEGADMYALIEKGKDSTVLTIGGGKLRAGAAPAGDPAKPMKITYETVLEEELLLPRSAGNAGETKIANTAKLFAGKDGVFHDLGISGKYEVSVKRPDWLAKEGKTTRHTDGTGSTTDWTITFFPNGFTFTDDNALTLHDQLPEGSTLVDGSVKIDNIGVDAAVTPEGNNGFFIPSVEAAKDQPVKITYQTTVPEEMYDSGTSLGDNTAWFTFRYQDKEYKTPEVKTPVGSGDGSGKPGTAALVKENGGYHAKTRSIDWTVKINPHKAYLKSGTFVDDLGKTDLRSTGGTCSLGHAGGLKLINDSVDDVTVLIDGNPLTDAEKNLVKLQYDAQSQVLTVTAGEIGARTITLQYTTKVCDPCIFANNTDKREFVNEISTTDMVVGRTSDEKRSASAQSPVEVSAKVLTKKAPVYDYNTGIMSWTLEVDAAGLSMTDLMLTDTLPTGLTYVDGSFRTEPAVTGADLTVTDTVRIAAGAGSAIPGADLNAARQKLVIDMGSVSIAEKTLLMFDTRVDPEKAGFNSDGDVTIENTAFMTGSADGVPFAEVSHKVQKKLANHGLLKSSKTDNQNEWIEYEVLINPFGLSLPQNPSLVDTLDRRLQLDEDTLRFYEADLSGSSENAGQKPGYTKKGAGQSLKVVDFDPGTNSFTVRLPIQEKSRGAYVLAYRADMIEREAEGYGNSVRFEGGSVKLGGVKQNSAAVSGGGGGGGGGVASRRVNITITQTDSITKQPLAGVTYTLYQWDSINGRRGLPVAEGTTDARGQVSFKVKPGADYVLVQTKGILGYDDIPGWEQLPEGMSGGGGGILIAAGAAGSGRELELTNKADNSGKPDQPGNPGNTGNGDSSSSGSGGSTGNGDSGGMGSSGSTDGSGHLGSAGAFGMFGKTDNAGIFGAAGMNGIFGEDSGNMLQADGGSGLKTQSGGLSGRGVDSPQTGDDTSWQVSTVFPVSIAVILTAGILYVMRKRKKGWRGILKNNGWSE